MSNTFVTFVKHEVEPLWVCVGLQMTTEWLCSRVMFGLHKKMHLMPKAFLPDHVAAARMLALKLLCTHSASGALTLLW